MDPTKFASPQEVIEMGKICSQIMEIFHQRKEQGISSKLEPIQFEKDDDTNFHIDFMSACSNLRARNYKIKEIHQREVKMIAGRIVPAISTTTAFITGVVTNEIMKFV